MTVTSVEGLFVFLFFVVPGAVGLGLRDYLWSGRDLSAFEQLLLSVTYSTGGLVVLETAFALWGLLPGAETSFGDFGLRHITDSGSTLGTLTNDGIWVRFLVFVGFSASLPSVLRYLRSTSPVLRLKRVQHLSLHSVGFEALFEESVSEAARWDERWKAVRCETPWLMVETTDDRRFQGQLMWRSSAPDPPEIILIDVSDVTIAEEVQPISGLVLIRDGFIKRLWVLLPDNDDDKPTEVSSTSEVNHKEASASIPGKVTT